MNTKFQDEIQLIMAKTLSARNDGTMTETAKAIMNLIKQKLNEYDDEYFDYPEHEYEGAAIWNYLTGEELNEQNRIA